MIAAPSPKQRVVPAKPVSTVRCPRQPNDAEQKNCRASLARQRYLLAPYAYVMVVVESRSQSRVDRKRGVIQTLTETRMTKRIALVTGGMGGLGEAISLRLHDAGYSVVVAHTPENPNVDHWLATMEAAGRNFRAYALDVADYDACQATMAKILARSVGSTSSSIRRHYPRHGLQEAGQGQLGRRDSHQPGLSVQRDQAAV